MKKQKSTISLKTTPEKAFSFVRRNPGNTIPFNIRHNFYQNSFFQSKIIEWNNLDSKLWNSENFSIFKNNIFKLIRPKPSSFFNCGHLKGIRLITRLCLEFSHLSKHKIKCNFQNCLNPLCSCDSSFECTSYFLLNCPIYNDKRDTIMTTLNDIDSKILESTNSY